MAGMLVAEGGRGLTNGETDRCKLVITRIAMAGLFDTFYFYQLLFAQRLSIDGISASVVDILLHEPPLEHVVGHRRQHGLFGHFLGNYGDKERDDDTRRSVFNVSNEEYVAKETFPHVFYSLEQISAIISI